MAWTCAITGKGELTFQEALESEAMAQETINSISPGLQKALLLLTHTITTGKFNDIVHFLTVYSSQRFFLGEKVVANTMFGKRDALIARVIPPSKSALETVDDDICFGVDPDAYKYEIVSSEPKSKFKMIIGPEILSRSGLNRDKIKLFLRQHCIITKRGQQTEIKEPSVQQFGLKDLTWESIFAGPLPNFDPDDESLPSVRAKKKNNKNKEQKEGHRTKSRPADERKSKPGPKPLTEEQKKQRQEQKRLSQAEAKKTAREKAREEKQRQDKLLKERNRKRDDLECDDLKPLPVGVPVSCPIPSKLFGDALLILEFFNNFEEFFDLKEIFPHGFTFELLIKCLTEKSIKSCISDLLRITLATIFSLQEEEPSEVKKDDASEPKVEDIDDRIEDENSGNDSLQNAVRAANIANSNIKSLIGSKFSNMKMSPFTISEVLRQHLLSAGCYKVRNIYRGWYCTKEDPALLLKMEQPELMEKLATTSVYDLEAAERISIFQVLIHEIMSFPHFRDILETNIDQIVEFRKEIRATGAEYARWEREAILGHKQKKEESSQEDSQQNMDAFIQEKERKSTALEKLHAKLRQKIRTHEAQYGVKPLGRDRAYRRYWVFNSLPGLLVERDDVFTGCCVFTDGKSPSASPANNKENEFDSHSRIPGVKKVLTRPMVCTSDETSCPVHSTTAESIEDRWIFYTSEEDIDQLLESLNERGFRESELKKVLQKDKEFILESISKCPIGKLNSALAEDETRNRASRLVYYKPGDHILYDDKKPDLGLILSFMDILETFDEQLFTSGLTFRLNASMTHDEWKSLVKKVDPCKPSALKDISQVLLKLGQNIVSQHLTPPLGGDNGSMSKWIDTVSDCHSISQLFLLIDVLDLSVNWSRSALSAFCRVCKKKKDAAKMLICDSCNRGHHTYCLKPALDSIPDGEWHCPECNPKVKSPRKQPPRVSKDQDVDYDEVEEIEMPGSSSDVDPEETMVIESENEDSMDDNESRSSSLDSEDVCVICGANDDDPDIECGKCQRKFHMSCHPSKVTSRRNFVCHKCSSKANIAEKRSSTEQQSNEDARPKRKRIPKYPFDEEDEEVNRTSSGRSKEFVDFIVCSDLLKKVIDHKSSRFFMKHPSDKEVSYDV